MRSRKPINLFASLFAAFVLSGSRIRHGLAVDTIPEWFGKRLHSPFILRLTAIYPLLRKRLARYGPAPAAPIPCFHLHSTGSLYSANRLGAVV